MSGYHVHESGSKGKPTLVFLHGAATSGWMWQPAIDALPDFHCLNVDLPGHGGSSHLSWQSLEATADALAAIIRTRATDGKAFLIGLSLGGYVALMLMARHPACVERTLVSGVTAAPLPNPFFMRLQMTIMSYFLHQPWLIRQQAKLLRIPDDALETYSASLRSVSRLTIVKIFNGVMGFSLPPSLATCPIPTLSLAGEQEVSMAREAVSIVARTLPHAVGGLVPNVHHGWTGENPQLFVEVVRAWQRGAALPESLLTLE